MPLKPGILFSSFSHSSTSFRPTKLLTKAPVITITSMTHKMPEPGIVPPKLNKDSGKYSGGTMSLTSSKKNLITTILNPNGIQKSKPEIK